MPSPNPRLQRREIAPTGRFFETDAQGCLLPSASPDRIAPEWRPAVAFAAERIALACGAGLVGIYLRGSVADGSAVITHLIDGLGRWIVREARARALSRTARSRRRRIRSR